MHQELLLTSPSSLSSSRETVTSVVTHIHQPQEQKIRRTRSGRFVAAAVLVLVSFSFSAVNLPSRLSFDLCPTGTTTTTTTTATIAQVLSDLLDPNLPIVPSLKTDDIIAAKAIDDVLRYYSNNNSAGGWIDINSLPFQEVEVLRHLGKTIMDRNVTCGRPNILGQPIAPRLRYCFWENDLVSGEAMLHFSFEEPLWTWVWREFRALQNYTLAMFESDYNNNNNQSNKHITPWNTTHGNNCQLGFLDIGVNVGDWASPLRTAFPLSTPYFGIEGTPGTGAMAIANMRTSMEHHLRQNHVVGPTALLPYSLLSKAMIPQVRENGGVCFSVHPTNIGGQAVTTTSTSLTGTLECKPASAAGGTLLSHALRSLVPLQQSSCPGSTDWPRIYIAKIDIEGFEFKAMMSAMDWFLERPPCYLMLECQKIPETTAVLELLLDIGYDSLWRTHHTHRRRFNEFPPRRPFWTRSQNASLHSVVQADLNPVLLYKDYIFGFADKEKCVRRLLE